jgi:hypothetical protein
MIETPGRILDPSLNRAAGTIELGASSELAARRPRAEADVPRTSRATLPDQQQLIAGCQWPPASALATNDAVVAATAVTSAPGHPIPRLPLRSWRRPKMAQPRANTRAVTKATTGGFPIG